MDFIIDPLTGRPIIPSGTPTMSAPPPPGSMARQFFDGIGSGFNSVFGGRRNAMSGDPTLPPGLPGGDYDARRRPGAEYLGPGDGAPMFDPNPPPPPPRPMDAMDLGASNQSPPGPTQMDAADLGAFNQPAGRPVGALSAPDPSLPTPPTFQPPPDTAQAARTPPASAPVAAAPAPRQPQGSGGALMAPTISPDMSEDDVEAFSRRLIPAESSGRADVVNSGGYAGLFQFGAPRLQTLGMYSPGRGEDMRGWGGGGGRNRAGGAWSGSFNIPGFENVRTLDDFLANPDAQRAAFRAHIRDIDQTIDSTPGAEAFDRNGLRAVAHLGGTGGMRSFIESGGRSNTADGNGTTLSAYYSRFSGTDAPPGGGGMQGGGVATAPGSFQSVAGTTDRPPPLPAEMGDPASPTFMGMPAQALLAAGSAMMGAPNMMQGMGAAGQAFVRQANTDRAFDQGRRDRAEQRADRQQSRADQRADRQQNREDTNAYRNTQVELARARLAAAQGRGGGANGVHSSTVLQDPDTGTMYRAVLGRDNRQIVTTMDGQEVSERSVIDRLVQRQPGEAAQARDDIAQRGQAFEMSRAARALRPSIANARSVLDVDPDLTGPDLPNRVLNTVVEALGIPVGERTPENIAMIRQALQQGNMQTLMQIAPSLRPMSNVDLQVIGQMSPSLVTNPRMIRAWLDQMDQAAERSERMGADLARVYENPETARAMARTGGVPAWRERWEANEAATRRPGGQVQPNVERTQNPQGRGEWQYRTPGGVGFSFN